MKKTVSKLVNSLTAVSCAFSVLLLSACASSSEIDSLKKQRDSLANNNKLLMNQVSLMESQKTTLDSRLNQTSDVLSQKERELLAKSEALQKTNQELNQKNSHLEQTIRELREKSAALKSTEEQLRSASETLKKNRNLYDNLVSDLQSEVAANQIKIQEMKDGISLNLAQEILFNSGSAKLNESGKEVITKVSDQLKDIEYSTVVAGFTDNIPISGGLAKVYPSNWELAGARAASVVTLLEHNGVNSGKLQAVSFGENKPVASNETPEGRSLNRRIEIMLKPIK